MGPALHNSICKLIFYSFQWNYTTLVSLGGFSTPLVKSVGKVPSLDRLALVGLRSGKGEWNPVRTRLRPGQEPGWNLVRSPVGTRSGARLEPGLGSNKDA